MSKKNQKKQELKNELLFEIYGIVIVALSIIALASYGAIGRNLTVLSRFVVGIWDFIIPLTGVGVGIYVMIKRDWPRKWSSRLTGLTLMLIALLCFTHLLSFDAFTPQEQAKGILDATWDRLLQDRTSDVPLDIGSGMVGAITYAVLFFLFDEIGTIIILGAVTLSGTLLLTGFSYRQVVNKVRTYLEKQNIDLKRWAKSRVTQTKSKVKSQKRSNKKAIEDPVNDDPINEQIKIPEKPVIHDFQDQTYINDEKKKQLSLQFTKQPEPDLPDQNEEAISVKFETQTDLVDYRIPSIDLLNKKAGTRKKRKDNAESMLEKLEKTLESFGVQATVLGGYRGPTVTRYELQPHSGVKVSKIVNLADDIALALAARDIRIEAPIPGKSAIGIEVPNQEVEIVRLRDVLESSPYESSDSKLSIALGMGISGDPIVANLATMPHLLVAGATGAGKSVCINGIITSLLYKARPDEVKLMMIDPKMVELNIYNGIPHLLAPVVTDPRKAAMALKKVVQEMEKRYELFAKSGARDIERYNMLVKEKMEHLPYIVVIVDELADLMMVAPADVEDAICRLAQMARAAGIHLIIATQRPSVDVITGVIKANIPSRIAFAVSSGADSRTILDGGGAEKLLGRGDMLYLPIGASKPKRVQGAFLSDEEVEAVVSFVKEQQEANYQEEMIPTAVENKKTDDIQDELYPQAVELVLEAKTASVSLIQRRLRVGYTRAARLIDMMEDRGIIGPYEGSKPREVLLTLEEFEANKRSAI
ncbi:DNA translocase FtsK [Hazenella sp. IB182353]|uniref:FtsK/SpoIIIE family DNA translocase n=1 Tax=Polycladospora coralii TaxID=2771432 RepID=UPI001746EB3B|nr:DNA translocase FtsK [Polycladospora coralii]MBS7530826.1 DNA translocase FtsK [Polycladospora coralii]